MLSLSRNQRQKLHASSRGDHVASVCAFSSTFSVHVSMVIQVVSVLIMADLPGCKALSLPSSSRPTRYLKWSSTSSSSAGGLSSTAAWNMQTGVTTFVLRDNNDDTEKTVVELHGMLHLGDPAYFDFYNSRTFNTQHDHILYELLVDQDLLTQTPVKDDDDETDSDDDDRTLTTAMTKSTRTGTGTHLHNLNQKKLSLSLNYLEPTRDGGHSPVQASPQDRATAHTYGWTCQADKIHYAQSPQWIHADWTTQELTNSQNDATSRTNNSENSKFTTTTATTPATQAVTALLVGPPLLQDAPSQNRRLFSSLTLPGTSAWATTMAYLLRILLWLTVPCPELSVLLVDWSTLLLSAQAPGVSPLTTALIQAMIYRDWTAVRQLLFGQVVLGRQAAAQANVLLIPQRNQRALNVLNQVIVESFAAKQRQSGGCRRIALLYGVSHCMDLQDKLLAAGYRIESPQQWRTAWSVRVSTPSSSSSVSTTSSSTKNTPMTTTASDWTVLMVVPLYLLLGGADWVVTWQGMAADVSMAATENASAWISAAGTAGLYLVRHVFLYVTLSQFLLDWNEDAVRLSNNSRDSST